MERVETGREGVARDRRIEFLDQLAVRREVHVQIPAEIFGLDRCEARHDLDALVGDRAGVLAHVEEAGRVGYVQTHDVLRRLVVVIGRIQSDSPVEEPQVGSYLERRLVLRFEVGIGIGGRSHVGQQTAVRDRVVADVLQEDRAFGRIEEVERVGHRVAADVGVAQAQFTEAQHVVLRDELREDEACAYRGVEVRTVRLGHGRRPVVAARHAQVDDVLVAQVDLAVDTDQTRLGLVVGRDDALGVGIRIDVCHQQVLGRHVQILREVLVDVVAQHRLERPVFPEGGVVGDHQVVVDLTVGDVVGVELSVGQADRSPCVDLPALLLEEVGTEVVGDRQTLDRLVADDGRTEHAVYRAGVLVLVHRPVEVARFARLVHAGLRYGRTVLRVPVVLQPVDVGRARDRVDLVDQHVHVVRTLCRTALRGRVGVGERDAGFEFVVELASAVERNVVFVVLVVGDDAGLVVRRQTQTEVVLVVAARYRYAIDIGMAGLVEILYVIFVRPQLYVLPEEVLYGLALDLGAPAVLITVGVSARRGDALRIRILEVGQAQHAFEAHRRVDRDARLLVFRAFFRRDDYGAVFGACTVKGRRGGSFEDVD